MDNPDIVYFFSEIEGHEELRYSLRSLENIPHDRVCILYEGAKPADITNVTWIEAEKQDGYKYDKEIDKFRQVATDDRISDDFVLFNDDFFILRPVHLDYYHKGTLGDTLKGLEGFYGRGYAYYIWLDQAKRALEARNLPTMDCELHAPMVFNRAKLLEVLNEFPGVYCTRSLYGNYHRLPLVKMKDNKSGYFSPDFDADHWFVSTEGSTFESEPVGEFIRRRFATPCSFEVQ